MRKALGIIEVRSAAGQMEAKLARKLGGKPLLELVVRRVSDCQRLSGAVVLLADLHEVERVRRLVPPDVEVFAPAARDPLGRFIATLDRFGADSMVRICAEHPFVDPVLIDRLVNTADAHPHCDYISYALSDGRPAILSQVGMLAEWCSAQALRTAHRDARSHAAREHVTEYLYAHPERFQVRLIPLPAELDRDDLRLKINREEDWEHAQAIYEAIGHDESDWQRITDFLDHQPALRRRMATLNQADARV
jgi:spore coat polysaccharide biosynthesis protein SpsF (cytidylyltransferase family)